MIRTIAAETELKKAEERAQLAEKSAALALNGRGALENALLGAQENAQVAQKKMPILPRASEMPWKRNFGRQKNRRNSSKELPNFLLPSLTRQIAITQW